MILSDDIYKRLEPVFEKVFDQEDIVVTPTLTAQEVEDWDSLAHIRLIISIEQEFGIRFQTTEVNNFKNVGELVALIQKKMS
jgi:acyl carrier protein